MTTLTTSWNQAAGMTDVTADGRPIGSYSMTVADCMRTWTVRYPDGTEETCHDVNTALMLLEGSTEGEQ